jgi:DNA repair exonuclease SbcCD ATPase subunit
MTDTKTEAQEILDKLTTWLESHGEQQPTRSTPWRLVVGLVLGTLAALLVAYAAYKLRKANKELARLQHERDVAIQDKLRASAEAKIADTQERIDGRLSEVKEADARLAQLEVQSASLEQKAVKTLENIDALQNWDDVDRYLARNAGEDDPS